MPPRTAAIQAAAAAKRPLQAIGSSDSNANASPPRQSTSAGAKKTKTTAAGAAQGKPPAKKVAPTTATSGTAQPTTAPGKKTSAVPPIAEQQNDPRGNEKPTQKSKKKVPDTGKGKEKEGVKSKAKTAGKEKALAAISSTDDSSKEDVGDKTMVNQAAASSPEPAPERAPSSKKAKAAAPAKKKRPSLTYNTPSLTQALQAYERGEALPSDGLTPAQLSSFVSMRHVGVSRQGQEDKLKFDLPAHHAFMFILVGAANSQLLLAETLCQLHNGQNPDLPISEAKKEIIDLIREERKSMGRARDYVKELNDALFKELEESRFKKTPIGHHDDGSEDDAAQEHEGDEYAVDAAEDEEEEEEDA
ncbi:hypothetical protein IAU59_006832 [Kwoniella sp. CBS 9459]